MLLSQNATIQLSTADIDGGGLLCDFALVAEWHEAHSGGVVYSTMLNAVELVNGSRTVREQWDDVVVEIEPKTF